MNKQSKEREINLIDLFWSVLSKWRLMLLWGLVFGVLAAGINYKKTFNKEKSAIEKQKLSIDSIQLEETSLMKVKSYLIYKEMYKEQLAYNENSILMKLDSNGFYRNTIIYFVENDYLAEYPDINKVDNIDSIIEAYKSTLNTQEINEEISLIIDEGNTDTAYCAEVIQFDESYKGAENIYVSAGADERSVLTVNIYGSDEESCKKVAELVKDKVEVSQKDIQNKLGIHAITVISDECIFIADTNVLNYQKRNIEDLNKYTNAIVDIEAKFNGKEKEYLELYYKHQANESLDNSENMQEDISVPLSRKAILIGVISGIVVVFFVELLKYLFDSNIKLEDDFEEIYQEKLLGNIIIDKGRKKKWFQFIDEFIRCQRHYNKRYFAYEEAIKMTTANIRIAAQKQNTKKIFVTASVLGKNIEDVLSVIQEGLCKDGIELILGDSILYNAEALENLISVGQVIIVEEAGVSLYKEIADEIELFENQEINIIGCIILA